MFTQVQMLFDKIQESVFLEYLCVEMKQTITATVQM